MNDTKPGGAGGKKSITAQRSTEDRVPATEFSRIVDALSKQLEERRRYRARVARGEYELGGRPPFAVPRESVELMRKNGLSWGNIARSLRCSRSALDSRRRAWEKQDIEARIAEAFARALEPAAAPPPKQQPNR